MTGGHVHFWIFAPVFILSVCGEEQQCYVCVSPGGGGSSEVESLFPGSPLADCRYTAEKRSCPANHRGCLTQNRGGQVTRTCAPFALEGCRAANGVEYCYCTGQLCNTPPPPTLPPPAVTDDEDLAESEASGEGEYLTDPPPVTRPAGGNKTKMVSASSRQTHMGHVVLLLVAVWR